MPWTVAHQAPLFMGISWQEYLSGLPFPPPGDQTHISLSFCLGKQILYHWDFLHIYAQFSSAQSLSHVWLFATLSTAARQASLSINNSRSLLKLMSIDSVMLSNHLILCCPLLLLPSSFPSIRVFSNESALHIRWPKYWSFSFNISLSNEYLGLISLYCKMSTTLSSSP